MNITQEKIDDLNAVLKIQLKPEDYKGPVDDAIKKYAKKVTMQGFRPGMVPVGMVRKMYGKALLADELNRLVADSVDKYITEQKLELLGHPMAKPENDFEMDWEQPADFEFAFEMGIAPQISLNLPPAKTFTYYEISVDDKTINAEVERLQKQYGEYLNPETTDVDSSVFVKVEELENGELKEGGITNKSYLLIDKITDKKVQEKFIGKKIGDGADFNPVKAIDNTEEVKYLLGLKVKEVASYSKDFRFTIDQIHKVAKAQINSELFDKVYGEGKVTTEEEFRDKIREEIAQSYRNESEHKLKHDLEDYFLHEMKINLPDDFLKRWLVQTNKKLTVEQMEKEYPLYQRDLKWRLVETKIFKDNNLEITNAEIEAYARNLIVDQYVRYGQAHLLTEEILQNSVKDYLAKEGSVERAAENISSRKVFEFLSPIISKEVKNMTHDEFGEMMKAHTHEHAH